MVHRSNNVCINLWGEGSSCLEYRPDVYIVFKEYVIKDDPIVSKVTSVSELAIKEWLTQHEECAVDKKALKCLLEQRLGDLLEGISVIFVA